MLMGNPTTTRSNDMATRTKAKPAEAEVEEDLELDELDEDVAEEEAPAKANEVTFGVRNLSEYLTKKLGKEIKPKDLRTLIRKMAREDSPRVDREVVAGNRSRYDWPDGLKDPEVKLIIAAVTKGELEQGKKEALDALKARKAEQKAAGETKTKTKTKAKAPVEEEVEEDFDEDLLEDDDE
jgi:hypothetical protein